MPTESFSTIKKDKMVSIDANKKKIKVLAIDGGGVRGIIAAVIIKAIEDKAGKPITEMFDYITGTSIGGVLAASYVVSKKDGSHLYTSDYIINRWETMLNEVFPQDYWSWVKNSFGVFSSKYDRTGVESLINKLLGENKLTDTMIPISLHALRLEDNMPKTFSTLHACSDQKENFYLKDAVAATAAAPPFFDPKVILDKHYIDGVVYANNPVIAGFAELERHDKSITPDDLMIVSVGTGQVNNYYSYNIYDSYGIWNWVISSNNILTILLSAASFGIEYSFSKIFSENSYRLQPIIPAELAAPDKPKNIKALRKVAEEYVAENQDKIAKIVATLIAVGPSNRLEFDCPSEVNDANPSTDDNLSGESDVPPQSDL